MRIFRSYHGRVKKHPAFWTVIVLICISFLIRLFTLSFSDNIGQAKNNIYNLIMSKLCINVMESGSSLISYYKEDNREDSFVKRVLDQQFILNEYTSNSRQAIKTFLGDYDKSLPGSYEDGLQEEITAPTDRAVSFHDFTQGRLTKQYILTNGAAFDEVSFNKIVAGRESNGSGEGKLSVGVMDSNLYFEESEDKDSSGKGAFVEAMRTSNGTAFTMEQLKDTNFLVRNFYIVDPATRVTESLFDGEVLMSKDMTMKQDSSAPQILIYHTHSQEAYIDSREGEVKDTVVGVGNYLTYILEDQYGYNVIHDTSSYDFVDGVLDRNTAYNFAEEGISKMLEDNPTIEVVIDLHRDGVDKRSTIINGEETAQIMLLNGLSRDENGPITYLDNPNLQDNLAFSLQLQIKSLDLYPGLFYRNYLQDYRYNMHVRPKCILMELGTNLNTLKEAKNAMKPFAKILDTVLKGK